MVDAYAAHHTGKFTLKTAHLIFITVILGANLAFWMLLFSFMLPWWVTKDGEFLDEYSLFPYDTSIFQNYEWAEMVMHMIKLSFGLSFLISVLHLVIMCILPNRRTFCRQYYLWTSILSFFNGMIAIIAFNVFREGVSKDFPEYTLCVMAWLPLSAAIVYFIVSPIAYFIGIEYGDFFKDDMQKTFFDKSTGKFPKNLLQKI
uniref:G_PROTEIN_RECEP_F1_2 domain-containing protein n=1 Tax=Caenorhabditis tropicalis TaxID=1561998 RepID=A0A1I7UDW8_9PELO